MKAAYEKDETRTADDNPSHDEKNGVINTKEVQRFKQYYAEIRGGEIRGVREQVRCDEEGLSPGFVADQWAQHPVGERRAQDGQVQRDEECPSSGFVTDQVEVQYPAGGHQVHRVRGDLHRGGEQVRGVLHLGGHQVHLDEGPRKVLDSPKKSSSAWGVNCTQVPTSTCHNHCTCTYPSHTAPHQVKTIKEYPDKFVVAEMTR